MLKGAADEVRETLAPLTQGSDALAAYASALSSLAIEDIPSAVQHLQQGLERPQAIPALEQDMARLLNQLLEREKQAETTDAGTHGPASCSPITAASTDDTSPSIASPRRPL